MIAAILRYWADQIKVQKPAKRGNPAFKKKVYDANGAAIEIGRRERFGESQSDAIKYVADAFDVDESTMAKIYRERRDAVDNYFLLTNLKHWRRNSTE